MQIVIDGQEIEFTLETEESAADIVASMEKWLSPRNAYINGMVIDGEKYDPMDAASLGTKKIPDIARIEFETGALAGLEMDNALDVVDYLERYLDSAMRKDPEIVSREGIEGLGWVMTSVRLAAGLNMINLLAYPDADGSIFQDFVLLESILAKLGKSGEETVRLDGFISEVSPLLPRLLDKIRAFFILIAKKKDTDFDPAQRADACREELAGLKGKLGELSTDLQTGNELKAMQAIQETTLHLDNLFSFLSVIRDRHGVDVDNIVSQGVTLKDWNERLVAIGNEIIAAFNNEDTILLGDLFEYEIAEELDRAPGFIDAVKDAIHALKS